MGTLQLFTDPMSIAGRHKQNVGGKSAMGAVGTDTNVGGNPLHYQTHSSGKRVPHSKTKSIRKKK